ncbi:MAG TPA: TonB family protein [Pyrinomonadaceae bacterium]|nr:TonB family protein [Pyrinomonadaceae bacterium]
MFGNLIESGSHAADLKRKSRFFIGTTLFYGLLMLATGVGSIYAYNARLEERGDEYELLAIMRFTPADRSEPRREAPRPAASRSNANQIATRTIISVHTPYREKDVAPESAVDINSRTPVVLADFNSTPVNIGGPVGPVGPGGHGNNPGADIGPVVAEREGEGVPPAIVRPTPAPTHQKPSGPVRLTSEVITSKAINKPAPPYPSIAKQAGIQGPVSVQVLIDEQGRVVSAKATTGHPMLQGAAVQAAYRASFTPTKLSGQPVKVTGVITYNFVLQ